MKTSYDLCIVKAIWKCDHVSYGNNQHQKTCYLDNNLLFKNQPEKAEVLSEFFISVFIVWQSGFPSLKSLSVQVEFGGAKSLPL